MRFTHYLALGDSMSTNEYPSCDLLEVDAVPAELLPAGAAALMYRNLDDRWPEFARTDLATLCPGIEARVLAWDGAMIEDVLTEEVIRTGRDAEGARLLITLTAGGNDLLDALTVERKLAEVLEEISGRYEELVTTLRDEFPGAVLLLTTVYDPTDGSGLIPELSDRYGRLPIEHLQRFNDHVRRLAGRIPGARLADVHRHFLGHGVSAPPAERWYWRGSLIEPSARGASEIRRVWWRALVR
jgi:acyl-CoA thioesterase I